MGIIGDYDLTLAEQWQEPAALIFVLIMTFYLTNVTLDIAFIRYRWRLAMLFAKFVGLLGALFFAIWPNRACLFCLGFSVLNGFADPRLHIPSIGRNPCHFVKKWIFALTQLCHHGGSALLIVDMLTPLVLQPRVSSMSIDMPIIGACMAEVFSWMLDTKVLMRTAPRWFERLHHLLTMIQVSCVVSVYLWCHTGVCPATLFTSVVGSVGWLVSAQCGFKASTYEEEDGLTASIARAHYKRNLLTVDPTVKIVANNIAKTIDNV
jgi:hypothetical protein